MGIFIVTATSTDDDYKRPYSHSETKMATSRKDAVARAAEFYLEEALNTDKFEWHDSTKFKSIVSEYAGNLEGLTEAIYTYFDHDEDQMFVGEFVPNTFYVTIGEEQEGIDFDRTCITNLITQIQETLVDE